MTEYLGKTFFVIIVSLFFPLIQVVLFLLLLLFLVFIRVFSFLSFQLKMNIAVIAFVDRVLKAVVFIAYIGDQRTKLDGCCRKRSLRSQLSEARRILP